MKQPVEYRTVPGIRIWHMGEGYAAAELCCFEEPVESNSKTDADTALPPLLTVKEVARKLALSESQVYSLAQEGLIPSVRIGRSIRFVLEEINNWFEHLRTYKRDDKTKKTSFEQDVDNLLKSTRIEGKV